ncbi:protein MpCYP813-like3 [Marchantia polymorpha subsp. ruderalis]|uniref:Cytochrome P450 n=2 Tax=Marchantia polymorpha TaxID=3197 RepID=A0A176W385_MARPO|nr:hypothetical protein AXG93_793s1060 [Marchantia polymorpha subsp. ruderalis]PTQ34652.1 hypothetical protein MARPO_0078s0054 [Marchantia polymorpha]BBN10059.1 hypothetical protein Mp_5g00550 [Marchantia polymorpha subsp. ruderalis]|eukprot:PTQ34652.1 hypothetical protein MARPO_0078s0054 [Marchantia polymorpha]
MIIYGIRTGFLESLLAIFTIFVIWSVLTAVRLTLWNPLKVLRFMRKRGYSGPPLSIFKLDNSHELDLCRQRAKQAWNDRTAKSGIATLSHDLAPLLYPEFKEYQKQYGERFVYAPERGSIKIWAGNKPDVIREVWGCKTGAFGKPSSTFADELLGRNSLGLVVNLDEWARQRRVVRPHFYEGQLKDTVRRTKESALLWIRNLEEKVTQSGDSLPLDLSGDIASLVKEFSVRTIFGNDFESAQKGLEHEQKLKILVIQSGGVIHPLLRYILPTRLNREILKARKLYSVCIKQIMEGRKESVRKGNMVSYGDDMLGIILTAAETGEGQKTGSLPKWTEQDIVDQIRALFFASHDTVSSAFSWLLILLGHHTEWQERIRKELTETLGEDQISELEQLRHLNSLNMFVLETLRLYPPFPQVNREVHEDGVTLLGDPVPKGLGINFDMIHLHRLPELWGDDALEFKPERWAKGMKGACVDTAAYNPFGYGPRVCAGQTQAQAQLKVLVSLFIQHFRFQLSPSYIHLPTMSFSMVPGHGVPLVIEAITKV